MVSVGTVKMSSSYGGWIIGDYSNGRANMFLANERYRIEVVNDIYDNPELLECT